MAYDIIITEGSRLTVVADNNPVIPEAVLIQDGHIFLISNGEHFHIGELMPNMRKAVMNCNFAMFVLMEQYSVKSSSEIRLQIDLS